jgi:hypothetical protein
MLDLFIGLLGNNALVRVSLNENICRCWILTHMVNLRTITYISKHLLKKFLVLLFHGRIRSNRSGVLFVLSGFLITYLLLEEEANTGTINIRNFI